MDWISDLCKTVALLEIKGNLSRIYRGIEKLLTILSWLCKTGIFWNKSSGTWSPVFIVKKKIKKKHCVDEMQNAKSGRPRRDSKDVREMKTLD